MPEPKTHKNRVHLDIRVSGGPDVEASVRHSRIDAKARSLVALGATIQREVEEPDGHWMVLQDPEGNEFCVT